MDDSAQTPKTPNRASTQEPGTTDAEEVALAKILFGIAREWELEPSDLEPILGVASSMISSWRDEMRIPYPKDRTEFRHNQIQRFINLWQSVSSLLPSRERQVRWLKEPNKGMGDKSPLQLLSENPESLAEILELVDRLRNP